MRKNINHLFFFVTTKCNEKCKICSTWKFMADNSEAERLDIREIEQISRKLGRLKTLSLSGGEPFLREDIADICVTFYRNSGFWAVSIPTNGLLTEKITESVDKIASSCRRSLIFIELPLDDVYGRFDEVRGVKGAFERLKETFFRLRDLKKRRRNLHLKFNITYSYFNKNRIRQILDSARNVFGNLDFSLGLVHGKPRDIKAKEVRFSEYFDAVKRIYKDYESSNNLAFRAVRRTTLAEFERRLMGRPKFECLAGKKFVALYPNGEIYPCEILTAAKWGNLRDFGYDISKLILERGRGRSGEALPEKCVCDWSCGVSRSIWDSPAFPLRFSYNYLKELFFQ